MFRSTTKRSTKLMSKDTPFRIAEPTPLRR